MAVSVEVDPGDSLARGICWLQTAIERARVLADGENPGLLGTSIAGTWMAAELGEGVAFLVDEDPYRA